MLVPSIFSDNFFDDFFEFPFIDDRAEKNAERKLYGHHAANLMKTDIKEFDDKYEVEIDLPGFKKDEVQVELRDGYLVVSAEKGLDEDEKKLPLFLDILTMENPDNAMVFCGTREMVEVLYYRLRKEGIACGMLHGMIDQKVRTRTIEDFRKSEAKRS